MVRSRRFLVLLVSIVVALCLAPQVALAADGTSALAAGSPKVVAKDTVSTQATARPKVMYRVYAANGSWVSWKTAAKSAGWQNSRIQLTQLKLSKSGMKGGITYRVYEFGRGWTGWVKNGATAGISGVATKGIQIKLTGNVAKNFDVVYRVYHATDGWLPWTSNGAIAGCNGYYGINQLQVKLVKKGVVQKLKEGAYIISPAKNWKNALAVPALNAANGSQAMKAAYGRTAVNERFYVRNEAGGQISIQSVSSGKFLCMKDDKVVLGNDSSDPSCRWVLKSWQGGYAIASAANGKRLKIQGGKAVVGTGFFRWSFSDVELIGDGNYTVQNKAQNNMLAISGMSYDNYANVMLGARTDSDVDAQTFKFTSKGGNVFRIDNAASFKAVGVANGSAKNGANVRQATWNSSNAQKWKAEMSRRGGIVFTNLGSGKVLTANLKGKVGANVVSSTDAGMKVQLWGLRHSSYTGNVGVTRCVQKANGYGSSTRWLIAVDLTNHWLVVFKGSRGNWSPYLDWQVSTGKPSSPTVSGSYTVGIKQYSFGHGYTCYYATQFYGDYLFHSVKYHEGTFRVMDGRLGKSVSMGCVRMDINNAKWIYNNIPGGTRVVTFW